MGIGHWGLGIGHRALGIGHWALGIGHWASGIGHWASGIPHHALEPLYCHTILDFRLGMSDDIRVGILSTIIAFFFVTDFTASHKFFGYLNLLAVISCPAFTLYLSVY